MMEGWHIVSLGLGGIALIVIGALILLQFIPKGKGLYYTAVVIFLILGGNLMGAGIAGRQLRESDNRMDQVGWEEYHDFVVVSVDEDLGEFCGVVDDDDNVVCANLTEVLNYKEPAHGYSAVLVDRGYQFTIFKLRALGEEGFIFEDP